MIAAFLWVCFQMWTSSLADVEALKEGLLVLAIGMTLTTFWYGIDTSYFRIPRSVGLDRRLLLRGIRDVGYIALGLIGAALPLPSMIVARRLESASNDDGSIETQLKEIVLTADVAKSQRIKVDPDIAERAALHILRTAAEAGSLNQEAIWPALTAISNYISYLNADRVPKLQTSTAGIHSTRPVSVPLDHFVHETGRNDNGALFVKASVELAKDDEAGIIEKLGDGHELEKGYGPRSYLLTTLNGFFVLDDLFLRNVIFQEVRIIYRGGAVTLNNVRFVDCAFFVSQNSAGLSFLQSVATSVSVTFIQP